MKTKQLALDALRELLSICDAGFSVRYDANKAIAALEADIAQAVEPVACAWAVRRNDGGLQLFFVEESARRESECGMWRNPVIPLYTTPPEPAVNAELLDALKAMVEIFKSVPEEVIVNYDEPTEPKTQWDYDAFQILGSARAAIAKATS